MKKQDQPAAASSGVAAGFGGELRRVGRQGAALAVLAEPLAWRNSALEPQWASSPAQAAADTQIQAVFTKSNKIEPVVSLAHVISF